MMIKSHDASRCGGIVGRRTAVLVLAGAYLLSGLTVARARQATDDREGSASDAAVTLTNERVTRWQLGVVVRANGATTGILATLPVPMPWPEQDVEIVDQQQSPHVRSISFRVLEDGVKQMQVQIPRLAPGEKATAIVTLEIVKRDILPPTETHTLQVPRRGERDLRKYLKPSPYIESDDGSIVQAAAEAATGAQDGWSQAEAIYDWVRERIEYRFDRNIKSARKALEDGFGDCEEMTSLFIAMCRSQNIPARAVWIPGHCYPEFYLEETSGQGHWYPCQVAGTRFFGSMPEDRPILQKGDNFRVPGSREPQRYVQETLAARHAAAPPEVQFIQKKLE